MPRKESDDYDEVHDIDHGRIECRSEDDRPAWDIDLGHELRLGKKRLHAGACSFGKEVEHEDADQKLEGIMFGSGATLGKNRRKDEIEDREGQKRLEKRPEIPQNRPVVTELEIGLGEHPNELTVVFMRF